MADCELTPAQVRAELLELTRLGGLELREEVFDVLLDLTRLDVVPTAVSQVLKSLCNKSRGAAAPGVGGTTFKGAAGAVLAAAALRAAAATPAAAAAAPPAPL